MFGTEICLTGSGSSSFFVLSQKYHEKNEKQKTQICLKKTLFNENKWTPLTKNTGFAAYDVNNKPKK